MGTARPKKPQPGAVLGHHSAVAPAAGAGGDLGHKILLSPHPAGRRRSLRERQQNRGAAGVEKGGKNVEMGKKGGNGGCVSEP